MEDRVRRRLFLLERVFSSYRTHYTREGANDLVVNMPTLQEAVISYWYDIDRLKAFHGIDYADQCKQAAFTIKWILKLRPFSFSCEEDETKAHHMLINEAIAWHAALTFMKIAPYEIQSDMYPLALYTFRNRVIDEGALLLLCKSITSHVETQRELQTCKEQLNYHRSANTA